MTRHAEKYVCIGSVRGWCGHRHRDMATATRCIADDVRSCETQGGYSDRAIYRLSDLPCRDGEPYIPTNGYGCEPVHADEDGNIIDDGE